MTGELENTGEAEVNQDFEVEIDIENHGELEIEGEAEYELEMEEFDGFEIEDELENDFEMEDKADLELDLDFDKSQNKGGFANGARGFLGKRGFGRNSRNRFGFQSRFGGYGGPSSNSGYGGYGSKPAYTNPYGSKSGYSV